MKRIESVAVVLPAFNEEKDLPALLARIQETLTAQSFRYQVIVVDDGSKDRTAEIAGEAAGKMPLTLIQHEVNKGLGMGIQTGLSAAMKVADVVVVMDSDNTHDPIYVMDMVRRLETEDLQLVIASRYQPGSVIVGLSAFRKMLSLGCFLLMKTIVPFRNVRDYSTGFRAYDSALLKRMAQVYGEDKLVEESGFVCMLEVLLKLRSIGTKAGEIPYTLRYDLKEGVSKLRIWKTLKRYLAVVNRYRATRPEAANIVAQQVKA
ncbi:glycosyltransferase family 2 protein [Prosthecobacter dejongeii]|uniref:Dolichol-phosphate mannosyltransferase n=1 Tax=Prosthecobacter dejongeii TaxID=48465 RepID=A0A7W8DRJ0_9BACT|nr:glycosyltransferase family 2 protein [Prosthecobacter dejongeii]MBB5039335.1 dolichol-phosphate mannosyltransferase [Prosthecobacter dejongeii]